MRVQNFEFVKTIGKGCYSTVYRATRDNTNLNFAIKVIPKVLPKGKPSKDIYEKEINTIKKVNHYLFVKYFNSFEDDENYYIIMEECQGGSLKSYIEENGPLSEAECRKYFVQILTAIEYLHTINLSIANITPDHILLDQNGDIRVSGFGHDHLENIHFISPEYFKYRKIMKESDIWCLGVLLYYASTKTYPFPGDTVQQLMKKILFTNPTLPPTLSPALASLISICLTKDTEERPTVENLKENVFYSPRELSIIEVNIPPLSSHLISRTEEIAGNSLKKSLLIGETNDTTLVYEAMKREDETKAVKNARKSKRRDSSQYLVKPRGRRGGRERSFSFCFTEGLPFSPN